MCFQLSSGAFSIHGFILFALGGLVCSQSTTAYWPDATAYWRPHAWPSAGELPSLQDCEHTQTLLGRGAFPQDWSTSNPSLASDLSVDPSGFTSAGTSSFSGPTSLAPVDGTTYYVGTENNCSNVKGSQVCGGDGNSIRPQSSLAGGDVAGIVFGVIGTILTIVGLWYTRKSYNAGGFRKMMKLWSGYRHFLAG